MTRTLLLPTLALCSLLSLAAQAAPQSDPVDEPAAESSWTDGAATEPATASEEPAAVEASASARAEATISVEAAPEAAEPTRDRPAASAARARGAHRHDGFYLRLGMGGGSLGAQGDRLGTDGAYESYEFRGGAFASEVMVGGTPAPGITLGGGYWAHHGARTGAAPSDAADSFMSFGIMGPFVDVFPSPRGGFHFGGALGPAASVRYDDRSEERAVAIGFGGSLWAGYDFFISDQWSLGASLRLSAARVETPAMRGLEIPERDRLGVGSAALLISALYH